MSARTDRKPRRREIAALNAVASGFPAPRYHDDIVALFASIQQGLAESAAGQVVTLGDPGEETNPCEEIAREETAEERSKRLKRERDARYRANKKAAKVSA